MAGKRSEDQKAEVAAFVNQLFDLSGAATTVEWAANAGLYDSNVSEYRSGVAIPDGLNLLKLIRASGVELQARGKAADLGAPPAPRVRPGELQGAVGELIDWQTTAIEQLSALDTRLAQLESETTSRQSTRRESGTGAG